MKITATKRDDVLKRKQEYEADKAKRQSEYDEEYRAWGHARDSVFDAIKSSVESRLAKFDKLNFDVRVGTAYGDKYIRLQLTCNENNKFDDSSALSWSYNAAVGQDGEIVRETSSWSGLQATTPDQMDSLRQTLGALEVLNSIDWKELLDVETPRYGDYVTRSNPEYETAPEDFDRLLREADIEDIIGTTSGVLSTSGKYYRGDVYRFITGQTDKTYTVFDIPVSAVERYVSTGEMDSEELYIKYESEGNTYRVPKDKFVNQIINPMKILKF